MITEDHRHVTTDLYDGLACAYDLLTAEHDHELWLGALLAFADPHVPSGRRALDCGCGTGKSIEPLLRRGWTVTGVDGSRRMLERAARRVPGARLLQRDLRDGPSMGRFDLVCALCDVVNYAQDEGELVAVLRTLRSNVADTGVVVFDANTATAYERLFCEPVRVADDACRLVARGEYDAATGTATATLDVRHRTERGWTHRRLRERQRRHSPSTIARAAADAGLRIVDRAGHGVDARIERPLDERRHTKAVYVAVPEPDEL